MSIVINYEFLATCGEAELVARLNRLRERALQLDLERVGTVRHIDPVCDTLLSMRLEKAGSRLPAVVAERIQSLSKEERELSLMMDLGMTFAQPQRFVDRLHQPAVEFAATTDLWDAKDYPEELVEKAGNFPTWSCTRQYILLKFAGAMLLHGYSLVIQPGKGCESVHIALAGYRNRRRPLWYGWGFTKTQYAERFVRDHENVCRLLDIAKEEHLLRKASDNCKFYEQRDWSISGPRVNQETAFIGAVSLLLDAGIAAANKAGAKIDLVSNPIRESQNYIKTEPKGKKPGAGRNKKP